MQLLADLPEACIDLTVTSPPYDDLRSYKGYTFDFEPVAAELFRVTKQGGVVVWVVGDATINGSETGTSFRQALGFMELGWQLHDTMIYQTNKPPLTHNRYEPEFEYMFVFSKGAPKTFDPIMIPCTYSGTRADRPKTDKGSRSQNSAIRSRNEPSRLVSKTRIKGNIWYYKSGGGHSSKDSIAFEHPAIFPEALARDHILSWSNPGDVILDPMCGSGTTLKMAMQMGRQWIGFDCSEEYCELARLRVQQANPPLFVL